MENNSISTTSISPNAAAAEAEAGVAVALCNLFTAQ
jgi:hypothetical protein